MAKKWRHLNGAAKFREETSKKAEKRQRRLAAAGEIEIHAPERKKIFAMQHRAALRAAGCRRGHAGGAGQKDAGGRRP